MLEFSSSLRTVSVARTLEYAIPLARTLGITRVTDTTRLDRIGVPVCAAIRPSAHVRSLHVSAGKGLRLEEARVGAYMEAIELAYAEPERAGVAFRTSRLGDVMDRELSPPVGVVLDASAVIDCIEVVDVVTGTPSLVPADLVVFPHVKSRCGGPLYFGGDGNGIASGNTLEEATLHGLTELVERDVTSFHNVKDRSELVETRELPRELAELVERLDRLGFDLWVRHLPNEFSLPVFKAVIYERGVLDGMHFGYGCHLRSSIACVRAVTEAIQCRLSLIHGGRDDFHRSLELRLQLALEEKQAFIERHTAAMTSASRKVTRFAAIPDHVVTSIEEGIELVTRSLHAAGLSSVLRARLDPGGLPVHVVRVIVPGLELYAHGIARMGRRLAAHLRAEGGVPEVSVGETAR